MLEDLEWCDVAVRQVAMFWLQVELLIKRIARVCCDTLQESLLNVPAGVGMFPLLFKLLSCVGRCGNSDGRVIGVRFVLVDVSVDACLMVVFVET
jgi:hypothetical protein